MHRGCLWGTRNRQPGNQSRSDWRKTLCGNCYKWDWKTWLGCSETQGRLPRTCTGFPSLRGRRAHSGQYSVVCQGQMRPSRASLPSVCWAPSHPSHLLSVPPEPPLLRWNTKGCWSFPRWLQQGCKGHCSCLDQYGLLQLCCSLGFFHSLKWKAAAGSPVDPAALCQHHLPYHPPHHHHHCRHHLRRVCRTVGGKLRHALVSLSPLAGWQSLSPGWTFLLLKYQFPEGKREKEKRKEHEQSTKKPLNKTKKKTMWLYRSASLLWTETLFIFGSMHILWEWILYNDLTKHYLQLEGSLSAPSACYDTWLPQFCSSPSWSSSFPPPLWKAKINQK